MKHVISFHVLTEGNAKPVTQSIECKGTFVEACQLADFIFSVNGKTLEHEGADCDTLPGLHAIGRKADYVVTIDGSPVSFEGAWYDKNILPAYVDAPAPTGNMINMK